MTIEIWERANYIRGQIRDLSEMKHNTERLKARELDDDFNTLREIAHSLLRDKINKLEDEFKELGKEKK